MKNKSVYILILVVLCCVAFGCASAKNTTKRVVDTTYNAVEKTDNWIEENMW